MNFGIFGTHVYPPDIHLNPKSREMSFAHIFPLPYHPVYRHGNLWLFVLCRRFRNVWATEMDLEGKQGFIRLDSEILLLSQRLTLTIINETDDANGVQRTQRHNETWCFTENFLAVLHLAARWNVWCALQETGHVSDQQSTTYRAERTQLATSMVDHWSR